MVDRIEGEQVVARLEQRPQVKHERLLEVAAGTDLRAIDVKSKAVVADDERRGVRGNFGKVYRLAEIDVPGLGLFGSVGIIPDPFDGHRRRKFLLLRFARGNLRCGRGIAGAGRSEEHTSELQSLRHLVCRLLLEK